MPPKQNKAADMKRAGTMAASAADGKAFLEKAQKKDGKLGPKRGVSPPKIKRTSTMAASAADGEKFLAKAQKRDGKMTQKRGNSPVRKQPSRAAKRKAEDALKEKPTKKPRATPKKAAANK